MTKWTKPVLKGYLLYDTNEMTFWKRQNYGDSERIGDCQGLEGGEGWTGVAQRLFRTGILSCMILWWCIHDVICSSKLREHTAPKVKSNINYGLQVSMTCHCRFISFNTCTSLVGDVASGESYAWVGIGDIWKISVLSAQFFYKPKLL